MFNIAHGGSALLAQMEDNYNRWARRLVEKLGSTNVTETVERLHELKRVLDTDAAVRFGATK